MILTKWPTVTYQCAYCGQQVTAPAGNPKKFCGEAQCRSAYEAERQRIKRAKRIIWEMEKSA